MDLLALVERAYPGWLGFDDPRYLKEEREYKVAASSLAQELLGEPELEELLMAKDFRGVLDRVRKVAQATNLLYLRRPSSGDMAVLERDELPILRRAELIYDLLHGPGSTYERLDRYSEVVQKAGLRPSWPLPTYLLFMVWPGEEVFVKPTLTWWLLEQPLRMGSAPDVRPAGPRYRQVVNRETYRQLREVYAWARQALRHLGYRTRDRIDLQSFFWIAHGEWKKLKPAPNGDDGPGPEATRVPFHPDAPAEADELGRRPFAEILAQRVQQIHDSSHGPATFAVHLHGPWGAGKTSVLNFLQEELAKVEAPWLVVDFNAWRQQRLRPPWWPFIRQVYEQAAGQLSWWARWWPRATWWWWKIRTSGAPLVFGALVILSLALFAVFSAGSGEGRLALGLSLGELLSLLGALVGVVGVIQTFHRSLLFGSQKAAQTYMEMRSDPLGPLSRLFRDLTRSFRRPLAIFIDDLDRCDADYVVELLEGVQTLFREVPVVYVVAADREWIRASFERRYAGFLADVGGPGRPLGHLFLEKMFQISVALPRLSPEARQDYWRGLLAAGAELPNEAAQKRMAELGEEELKDAASPQEIQDVVERHKGSPLEVGVRIAAAQRLSEPEAVEETEHFLAPYAALLEPNPRSMKRLVNAFGLQQSINLLAHVDAPLGPLALWTILQQRWPELADLLARHPELIASLDGGGALGEKDTRVPERLRELFGRESVRQVVAMEGRDARLEEEVLRRLVG